jgi:hypothetical protein
MDQHYHRSGRKRERQEMNQLIRLGGGSVGKRSLAEFTLSLSEGFEMINAYLVVIPSGGLCENSIGALRDVASRLAAPQGERLDTSFCYFTIRSC